MQATVKLIPANASPADSHPEHPSVSTVVDDQQPSCETAKSLVDGQSDNCVTSDGHVNADENVDGMPSSNSAADALVDNAGPSELGLAVDASAETDEPVVVRDKDQLDATDANEAVTESITTGPNMGDASSDATEMSVDQTASSVADTESSATSLPDPSNISARLKNLVVSVSQVEELSRRAREVAASDLALYDGIAASHRQFDDGLVEARRIGQEAEAVYQRAFGRNAKALAEPAVPEAREVEQAFEELADAWRNRAETFLAEHPDVEALLAEQQQHTEETRRREVARTKAQRFQQLVTASDAALRQGLLDDARDCLKLLGREFPAEATRVAPLQERLDHRVRAANDAAARRTLLQASELQGRGEFDAAVRLLEAVDVQGLSREASEDVFGRWSAACSLLGQSGGLELLRYSPTQGRGVVLHRDPGVPFGLIVFSSLGMATISSRGGWSATPIGKAAPSSRGRGPSVRPSPSLNSTLAGMGAAMSRAAARRTRLSATRLVERIDRDALLAAGARLPWPACRLRDRPGSGRKGAVSFDLCSGRR